MKTTLLQSLTAALNKIYDGNMVTMTPNDGISHVDRYICDCGAVVQIDEWSEEYKICADCYHEMMEDKGHRWGAL